MYIYTVRVNSPKAVDFYQSDTWSNRLPLHSPYIAPKNSLMKSRSGFQKGGQFLEHENSVTGKGEQSFCNVQPSPRIVGCGV